MLCSDRVVGHQVRPLSPAKHGPNIRAALSQRSLLLPPIAKLFGRISTQYAHLCRADLLYRGN